MLFNGSVGLSNHLCIKKASKGKVVKLGAKKESFLAI
jgi:hypothetical protein